MADSLGELQESIRRFVEARDWAQFHTPKNLAMAMIVEAAEVVEHFQWDTPPQSRDLDAARREAVGQELADTLIYLLRLAAVCEIDLLDAARRKIALNEQKYPAELARGSNAKYTAYQHRNDDAS